MERLKLIFGSGLSGLNLIFCWKMGEEGSASKVTKNIEKFGKRK